MAADAPFSLTAYYLDNPNEKLTRANLDALGVLSWKIDADNYDAEGKLAQICQERGYNYRDFVNSTKLPNLQEKLKIFFEEHLHEDEEIRFFLDGSGFFDVRGVPNKKIEEAALEDERWVRIECQKGDMIVLPPGIYHRFNPDNKMFFSVMRLFAGDPVWTAWNRIDPVSDTKPARQRYIDEFLKSGGTKRKKIDDAERNYSTPSFVRASSCRFAPEHYEKLIDVYNTQCSEVVKVQPGFRFNYMLADPSTGECVSLTAWDSQSAADTYEASGNYARAIAPVSAFFVTPAKIHSYTIVHPKK